MTEARRYVVIGAGAVGGALAAELVTSGHDVVLVARGEHGRAIADRGLTVRRPTGVDVVPVAVASGPDDVRLRAGDVLVLATKAQDAEAAITQWAWQPVDLGSGEPGLAADLPIVTYQNGLATEAIALRRFSRVYGATIAIAASYLSPGEIVSPSVRPAVGVVWLGRYPTGADDLARSLADDLTGSGFAAFAVDDVREPKAAKLVGNVSNGLDLLEGDDASRAEARAALRDEAVAALQAGGATLPAGGGLDLAGVEFSILPVEGHVAGRLSTWQSFARGTSSEVDHLNGEVVLLGRLHGVPTPVNTRLQRLLADPAAERTLDSLLSRPLSASGANSGS